MSCTTILVGKDASYDGSTMMARNDDSPSGKFTPKKFVVVSPEEQPRIYRSELSHVEIKLPDNPMSYTAVPNALKGEGIWAAAGVNAANVAMTATETITSNERVLGADPLVVYEPARKKAELDFPAAPESERKPAVDDFNRDEKAITASGTDIPVNSIYEETAEDSEVKTAAESVVKTKENVGGIGEEDLVVLVLPYIHSAREGVKRLGALLEEFGTYEMNGIGFQDRDEIWWMETIGGHHWMARRVPDDQYVVMPNQLGIDQLDLRDAMGDQKEYMCSADLEEFIEENHLDLSMVGDTFSTGFGFRIVEEEEPLTGRVFNPRDAFGSHDDADHVYNTPRAWYMERYFNPHYCKWDGPAAELRPESDNLPWSLKPERRITPEDIKYILSSHYQGTPFDPYATYGEASMRGAYRSIGVSRTDFMGLFQIRPYVPEEISAVEWIAFSSNVFNTMAPFYTNIRVTPDYLANTRAEVSTDNFYWNSRLIGALSDSGYGKCLFHVERYQQETLSKAHEILGKYDRLLSEQIHEMNSEDGQETSAKLSEKISETCEQANQETADMLREQTALVLDKVLYEVSCQMKNSYARSDA